MTKKQILEKGNNLINSLDKNLWIDFTFEKYPVTKEVYYEFSTYYKDIQNLRLIFNFLKDFTFIKKERYEDDKDKIWNSWRVKYVIETDYNWKIYFTLWICDYPITIARIY